MKILIICPHFRGIEFGIVDSFKRLGHDVCPVFFSVGMDPWHYYQRIKIKLNMSIDSFLEKEKRKFNKIVITEFLKFNPDYVYVIQGRWMSEDTVNFIKEKARISLYLWDMVSLFPEMIPTFKCYDLV